MNDLERQVVTLSTKFEMQEKQILEMKEEEKNNNFQLREEIKRNNVEIKEEIRRNHQELMSKSEKNNDDNKIFLSDIQKQLSVGMLKLENNVDKVTLNVQELNNEKQKFFGSITAVKFIVFGLIVTIGGFIVTIYQATNPS